MTLHWIRWTNGENKSSVIKSWTHLPFHQCLVEYIVFQLCTKRWMTRSLYFIQHIHWALLHRNVRKSSQYEYTLCFLDNLSAIQTRKIQDERVYNECCGCVGACNQHFSLFSIYFEPHFVNNNSICSNLNTLTC